MVRSLSTQIWAPLIASKTGIRRNISTDGQYTLSGSFGSDVGLSSTRTAVVSDASFGYALRQQKVPLRTMSVMDFCRVIGGEHQEKELASLSLISNGRDCGERSQTL